MVFQSLDTPTYYLFLALGLVFALSGLTFIFRGKADENAARFEFLGLKFQSSSAGTLVFLIGVGFLMIPLFVPRAVSAADQTPQSRIATNVEADGGSTHFARPPEANIEEIEPNGTIRDATPLAVGFGAKGSIYRSREDFHDWFVIDTADHKGTELTLQFRTLGGLCKVHVFNQKEEVIGTTGCNPSGGSNRETIYNVESDQL